MSDLLRLIDFGGSGEDQRRETKDKNCTLKIIFLRHGSKKQIDPHEAGRISHAVLSEKGKIASYKLGKRVPIGKSVKIYFSNFVRSEETAEYLAKGILEHYKSSRLLTSRLRSSLDAPHFSPEFINAYRYLFIPLPDNFAFLDHDTKERVIEESEGPALDFWIEQWSSKYDNETESASEIAQRIAYYVLHFDKMIDKLRSGSDVVLINITHRATIEPFLKYCLRPQIKSFMEVGGPFSLLERCQISIVTDLNHRHYYKFDFRGQRYELDWDKIKELADLHVKMTEIDYTD